MDEDSDSNQTTEEQSRASDDNSGTVQQPGLVAVKGPVVSALEVETTPSTSGSLSFRTAEMHMAQSTLRVDHLESLTIVQGAVLTTDEESTHTSEPRMVRRQQARNETEKDLEDLTKDLVETEAVRDVKAKISEGSTWITITGGPGDGKKKIAYLVMKDLNQKGKSVYIIRNPQEYFEFRQVKNAVFLFKDPLGHCVFCRDSYEKWRPVFDDLRERRDAQDPDTKKLNVIILVQRLNVLNSSLSHLGPNKKMIKGNSIDVSLVSISDEEKLSIWRHHVRKYKIDTDSNTVQIVCSMSKVLVPPYGFPHCCQRFAKLYAEEKTSDMKSFFMNPIEFLKENLIPLLHDNTIKSLFMKLLQPIKHCFLEFDSETQKVISEVEGTYIIITEEQQVKFIHESVYETVAIILSELQDAVFVIKNCRMSFLKERIRFKKQDGEYKQVAYPQISEALIKAFIGRSVDEIINKKKLEDVLSHSIWRDRQCVAKLMETLYPITVVTEIYVGL